MLEAFLWGLAASLPLVAGAAISFIFTIQKRLLGLIMAFGAGVLISAVAYELVEQAFKAAADTKVVAAGLVVGALAYFLGDLLIDRMGGNNRKRSDGSQADGSGKAIVLGTVLDGIPESVVIGLTILYGGAVSAAMVVAVFLSNVPEALAATAGLLRSGWKKSNIMWLWVAVVGVSALSALAGYAVFGGLSVVANAFVLAFAGGAVLTMLADTMMPEAYKYGGNLVGVITALGFCLAFMITAFE